MLLVHPAQVPSIVCAALTPSICTTWLPALLKRRMASLASRFRGWSLMAFAASDLLQWQQRQALDWSVAWTVVMCPTEMIAHSHIHFEYYCTVAADRQQTASTWTHISADPRRSVATAEDVVRPPDLVLISPTSSFSASSSPAKTCRANLRHHLCSRKRMRENTNPQHHHLPVNQQLTFSPVPRCPLAQSGGVLEW